MTMLRGFGSKLRRKMSSNGMIMMREVLMTENSKRRKFTKLSGQETSRLKLRKRCWVRNLEETFNRNIKISNLISGNAIN
jgi:hypothetical protein